MITKNTMTVTVIQDSNKWKVESHEEAPHPKRPYKGKGKGPYHLFGPQSRNFGPTSLGYSAPRPTGYERYGQHYSSFLCEQTWKDPFPYPVTYSSGSFSRASNSRHCHQGKAHSSLNVIADYLSRPNQPIKTEWCLHPEIVTRIDMGHSNSGHVCHSPQRPSSPVNVSHSGASNNGDRCFVTGLAGAVDIHVSTVSLAQQNHSETTCHHRQWDNSNSPMVAFTTVVPTSTSSVCGPPSHHSIHLRTTVTNGVCLRWQVIPSARVEALTQHYQEAGF